MHQDIKFGLVQNILLVVLFFAVQTVFASEDFSFISISRITPEFGLVNSQVHCITEDSLHYIWFGTNNGLFYSNSRKIKRFTHIRDDSTSIPSNRINIL